MIPVSMELADCDILECSCTIDSDFFIIMGDERFYRAFADNARYALDGLIYEEDRQQFIDFVNFGAVTDKIFVRCLIKGDKYRWMFIYKRQSDTYYDDKPLTDIIFYDALVQREKFLLYYNNVKKYRAMLTLIREKLFEYDLKTGMFTIYFYSDGRSEIIEKDSLDSWQKRVIDMGQVDEEFIPTFNTMCDDMRKGVDSFSSTFRTTFMTRGGRRDTLNFKGETLTSGTEKYAVVGLISEIGGRMEQKPFMYDNTVNKDSYTGILNKKAVTDEIISAIETADSKKMYMMVIDIDDFKNVNDTYGHQFGDVVIKTFATELQRCVDKRGIVGRIGGDEFIALLTDIDEIQEVKDMLTAVRKRVAILLAEKKREYRFSVSIGISKYPEDATNYDDLFKIADGSLYIAKEKGKDRYIIYNKELHGDLINRERTGDVYVSSDYMKPIEKLGFTSRLMIKLINKGHESVPDTLAKLMDRMNIHGISIYSGEDMSCVYRLGHYENRVNHMTCFLDKHFMERFDEHGICKINNIASLHMDFPKVYEGCVQSGVCSCLYMLIKKDNSTVGVITFDIFGEHRRKWSQDDINTIYMVVRAIENVW